MTLEEYREIKKRLDSGELDYDTLTKEEKSECRRYRLEMEKDLVEKRAKILEKHGLPTGLEMLHRDKSRPAYEVASRPVIIYDESNPEAAKNAKKIEKKREKAIDITGSKFKKREKELRKKAKKRAKKLRKQFKKKEWKKRVKKAYKIFKKLPAHERYRYQKFAKEHSVEEMVEQIIADHLKKKDDKLQLENWWKKWSTWHEFDQDNEDDVEALSLQVLDDAEQSPYEKFRQREMISGRPDPKITCGKYLKPRLELDESEKNYYATHITIKNYDWKEFSRYLKKKKIKKISDIVKYRRKFNLKKLKQAEANYVSVSGGKKTLADYMYVPLSCRDAASTLQEFNRAVKTGARLKGVVQEFADFIRSGNYKMSQETYDNLEKLIERQDKSIDKMVEDARVAMEQAAYESMRDDPPDDKLKPMDLDCTPKNLEQLFSG